MAESETGGGNASPAQQPKELSMEKRLLLAFVLMGAVLFTTPYFFKSNAPPPQVKKSTTSTQTAGSPAASPVATANPKTTATNPAANAVASSAQPISAQKEELFTVDTDLYRITFSNQGAVVRSWLLKKYFTNGKPLELVNTASTVESPFALYFKGNAPVDVNKVLYAPRPDANNLGITYEYSDGRVEVRKKFQFARNSYQSQVTTEVTQEGKPVPHSMAWRGGFGDVAIANPSANTWSLRFDATDGKLIKDAAKAAKDGPATVSGNFSFAGLDDPYFTASFLPEANAHFEVTTFSDSVPTTLESKPEPFVGSGVGGSGVNKFDLFVGPKDSDVLRQANPKLESLIDYGWFSFLARPLFLALHWAADHLIHNYGWAIVLVTVVINMLLFPLKVSSMRSMKKMQALQPQVNAINEKYKGISVRDPKAADKNAELMELYKKNGVNPAGGCLPMALQIPFFIAFYKVLSVSIEMRGASWLWVGDLSTFEHLPLHILPLVMIVTQFFQQKMTPTSASVDPTQQKMMLFMPLIFGFMFYNLPSGVVLYYLTSNLVGIAQQWFFNKTVTPADLPKPVAAGKKRNGKK
jgi:YidC/Oxa1 family membrane protein insertase